MPEAWLDERDPGAGAANGGGGGGVGGDGDNSMSGSTPPAVTKLAPSTDVLLQQLAAKAKSTASMFVKLNRNNDGIITPQVSDKHADA